MTSRDRQRLAWGDGDIVMVSIVALVGLGAIMGAMLGASRATTPAGQATWLSMAAAGFAFSALGMCLWLLRGRRAVGERRVALISLEADHEQPAAQVGRWNGTHPQNSTTPKSLVRVVGMERVHRCDCPLVAGKPAEPASLADGEPCGVCAP